MDKNLAALLRHDCKTVRVRFINPGDVGEQDFGVIEDEMPARGGGKFINAYPDKSYTYVTHLDVKVGDIVVVPARGEIKLARVAAVDDELDIEPQSTVGIKWVIDVVNLERHAANMVHNREIERLATKAQRLNMRRVFADAMISQLAGPSGDALKQLLNAPDSLA